MAFLAAIGTALGASAATATLTGVAALAGGVQLLSTIQASRAQAQAQRIQAKQSELQGRQNALQYNRQALQVFERQERLAAMARARAAAGGVDPFTGSPLSLQQANALTAGREMEIARQNAQTAIYGGLAQSQSLQAASTLTQQQGLTSALTTAAMQAYKLGETSTPTSAPVVERSSLFSPD